MPTSLDTGEGRNLALPLWRPRGDPPRPYRTGSIKSYSQRDPSDRVRQQSDCAQDSTTKVEQALLLHDPMQNPQIRKGAGTSGISGDDIRPVQHPGGRSDGQQAGTGKGDPEGWGSDKREPSMSR